MNYRKLICRYLSVVCVILLVGCSSLNGSSEPAETSEKSTEASSQIVYDSDDSYQDYTNEQVETIDLSSQSSDVEISEPGTYVLSGTLNGSVKIRVGKEETVRLVLDNANINASDFAAIYCSQAKKLIVSLKEGTINSLSDQSAYAGVVDEEVSATLFVKDDLTINGNGTLHMQVNVNDAITAKDTLKIMEGTYEITALDDGIVGRDYVYIHDGEFHIDAQGDGIKTTYDTDAEKGDMIMEAGTFHITAGADAIQAIQNLTIYDGDYEITSGGGSMNSSTSENVNQPGGFGRWNEETTQSTTESASAKGLKAGTSLVINGGIFNLDTSDDAIHCNGLIDITGGNISILSGDDGVHADGVLSIHEGSIDIKKSYEGLEGSTVNITGGNILVVASDDGMNAAGGSDGESGEPGADNFLSTGDYLIHIQGGTIQVDASGDGLDSNRNIIISGGVVVVNGPENEGNGALDFDGEFTITGGIMIATGSSGMLQSPSTSSQQNTLVINTGQQAANSSFYISDEEGNVVLGVKPTKSYASAIVTTPDLLSGEVYSIYINASGGEVNDAGYIESGIQDGTLLDTITMDNTITTIGSLSGGMGQGGMPQGGGPRR